MKAGKEGVLLISVELCSDCRHKQKVRVDAQHETFKSHICTRSAKCMKMIRSDTDPQVPVSGLTIRSESTIRQPTEARKAAAAGFSVGLKHTGAT